MPNSQPDMRVMRDFVEVGSSQDRHDAGRLPSTNSGQDVLSADMVAVVQGVDGPLERVYGHPPRSTCRCLAYQAVMIDANHLHRPTSCQRDRLRLQGAYSRPHLFECNLAHVSTPLNRSAPKSSRPAPGRVTGIHVVPGSRSTSGVTSVAALPKLQSEHAVTRLSSTSTPPLDFGRT